MVNKKSVKIEINLTNKWFYSLIFFGIFIIAGVLIYAGPPYSPSELGHTIDELQVRQADGSIVGLEAYLNTRNYSIDQIIVPTANNEKAEKYFESLLGSVGQLNCESTPIYNSMNSGASYIDVAGNYSVVNLPYSCSNLENGCVFKQEIYHSSSENEPRLIRQINFKQYSTNKWWSSFDSSGDKINGDRKSNNIARPFASGTILIRDDYYNSNRDKTKEESPSHITFVDRNRNFGMKVYVCSEVLDSGEDLSAGGGISPTSI